MLQIRFVEKMFGVTIYPCFMKKNCLSQDEFHKLCAEMRGLAKESFDYIPDYQCLREDYSELDDKLLIIHRNKKGELDGFSSSIVLNTNSVGQVFHLGLFLVSPGARHQHLQFKLGLASIIAYMLCKPFKYHYWFTNLSSVLGTLATVDSMYVNVYPGLKTKKLLPEHLAIAKEFQTGVESRCHISKDSVFDSEKFIYRKANSDTCFLKKASDKKFHGLKEHYNNYYNSILNLDEGDALLQVGYMTPTRALAILFIYVNKVYIQKPLHIENEEENHVPH